MDIYLSDGKRKKNESIVRSRCMRGPVVERSTHTVSLDLELKVLSIRILVAGSGSSSCDTNEALESNSNTLGKNSS